jgi:PAS domain S-box-containing protein
MPSDDTKRQTPAEGTLRESEIRALGDEREEGVEVFSCAPVGLYRTLPSGEVLNVNQELARMLGFGSADELRGVNAAAFYVNPEDRAVWKKAIDETGSTQLDSAMRRHDGRVIWFRDIGRAVREASGAVRWYEGALVDVTSKHRAEVELKRSEERFRRLLDAIPDAILRFTKEGVCVDARVGNLHSAILLESNPVGEKLPRLFSPELAGELTQAAQSCRVHGTIAFEHRVSGSRGSVFFDVVVSPSGRDEVLVLIRDVSSVRRMREQLFRGERLAAVGSLAMGVAHEINNPLTAVVVNLDFVRDVLASTKNELDEIAPPELTASPFARLQQASEALDDALQGAHRVADVVREIKTFASAGDERPSSVDIAAVLESATRLVNNQIRHRAKLVREFEGVPPVWGNAARLEEVFINLLVNAAQAIEPGRADENEVRVSAAVAADGRVVVEVSDTGSGIRPEDLERIFDPFFTTKPVGTGTGMGLSVSQAIVAGYGGEITCTSTRLSGTSFRVWLTRAAETYRSRASSLAPRMVAARARIAVIEDEQLGGRALKRVLDIDHDVYVTSTAQAALELIESGTRFDVILCDVMMPVMTGVEFHKRLTLSHPQQARRVVFITGGAFTEDERRYLEEIENTTLEKPVGAAELAQIIGEILARDGTGG